MEIFKSQMSIFEGTNLRDEGMKRAVNHADRVVESWSDQAFNYLVKYANMNKTFMIEDVRNWAEQEGLQVPPSSRSWGSVTVRAAKSGVIRKIGHKSVSNPKAHRAFASVWMTVRS